MEGEEINEKFTPAVVWFGSFRDDLFWDSKYWFAIDDAIVGWLVC
jgi:hypothetical protein